MPRLEPLPPPYSPSVTEDLTRLMPPGMEPLGLFKTIAHNPRVLGRVRRGGLLDPGSIPIRARELVILRTTALCGAEYEWGVHAAFFAGAAELSEEQLEATVTGARAAFSPAEQVLFDACEMLHERAPRRCDLGEVARALEAGAAGRVGDARRPVPRHLVPD
ncbi:MAG: carboxymuconolactone decarboxylase family protein [Myxococcaceae bacterium]